MFRFFFWMKFNENVNETLQKINYNKYHVPNMLLLNVEEDTARSLPFDIVI